MIMVGILTDKFAVNDNVIPVITIMTHVQKTMNETEVEGKLFASFSYANDNGKIGLANGVKCSFKNSLFAMKFFFHNTDDLVHWLKTQKFYEDWKFNVRSFASGDLEKLEQQNKLPMEIL